QLNLTEKEPILIISFPESDLGRRDYDVFINSLKKLNITTLAFSNDPLFITAASPENIFMINKNGGLYDIIKLINEIKIFNLWKGEDLILASKRIAYQDFIKDYLLLEPKMKEFLLSDKF